MAMQYCDPSIPLNQTTLPERELSSPHQNHHKQWLTLGCTAGIILMGIAIATNRIALAQQPHQAPVYDTPLMQEIPASFDCTWDCL